MKFADNRIGPSVLAVSAAADQKQYFVSNLRRIFFFKVV